MLGGARFDRLGAVAWCASALQKCCISGQLLWPITLDLRLLCVQHRLSHVLPQETVFQAQAAQLAAAIPQLFEPGCSVRLATENGRSLLAKAGFTASRCVWNGVCARRLCAVRHCLCVTLRKNSTMHGAICSLIEPTRAVSSGHFPTLLLPPEPPHRVEYTKTSGGRHIAVTHVGADLFMRACYLPETWGLRVFVCDSQGAPKEGVEGVELVQQDVAGPLCFQGDRLAVNK